MKNLAQNVLAPMFCAFLIAALAACAPTNGVIQTAAVPEPTTQITDYRIRPLDELQIFVWKTPELSVTVPVRPDGRISLPLIKDLQASGRTPIELASDIQGHLSEYIQDPIVNVMVSSFNAPFDQQIRVVGEANKPLAVPYRSHMTLLDVMIEAGGLTKFASGNRALVVRRNGTEQESVQARLNDLLRNADITANMPVMPGDVIIIPQSWL